MNKEEIIRIRVTKEFKEYLVKRAKEEGLTMSRFIRERLGGVRNSVCDCCVPSPEDPFEYENPICRKCGCAMKQTDC